MKSTFTNEETKEDCFQPESGVNDNEEIYQNNNTQENNKIQFSDDENEQPENNVVNTDEPNKNNIEVSNSNPSDQVDKKLNTFLNDFYSKKRVSQIAFRRVSQGNYEFGTQKVLVKVENEKIKGTLQI